LCSSFAQPNKDKTPAKSLHLSAFIPVLFGVWNLNVKNPHFFPVLIELVLLCLTNTPVFMDLMNIKVFRVVFIYLIVLNGRDKEAKR